MTSLALGREVGNRQSHLQEKILFLDLCGSLLAIISRKNEFHKHKYS